MGKRISGDRSATKRLKKKLARPCIQSPRHPEAWKTTIAAIAQKDDSLPKDQMWGLAWDVNNIEKAYQRLVGEGVEVTPIQKGIKEKTLVATVKSHTQNVPTLLIEHLD